MSLDTQRLTRQAYLFLMTMIVNRQAIQAVVGRRDFSSSATAPISSSRRSSRTSPLAFSSPLLERPTPAGGSSDHQRLVLIGGGHAHVQVIKALNKVSRPNNLQVTLIDVQTSASYSGMVPGTISGAYTPEDTLLHLGPLAEWAGIDFVHDKVVDIDIDNNLIFVQDDVDHPIPFDAVSVDIGSASRGLYDTKGAKRNTIATRPIAKLVERLEQASQELTENPRPVHVVVIGGGAAGLELSMSIKGRWVPIVGQDGIRVTVLDSGKELLPSETAANRNALQGILDEHDIQLRYGCTVDEVEGTFVRLTSGEELPFTHCLWATGAGAHDLAYRLQSRGLAVSDHGWIRVNENLQSISHPRIFAAGDCCTMEGLANGRSPPKAGVYAVRSGPVLIDNLTRILNKEKEIPLTVYNPQDDFLKLMVCGDGTALGFRFGIPIRGKWVFELKDAIDNGFMDLFRADSLPELKEGEPYDTKQYDATSKPRPSPMSPRDAAQLLLRTDEDVDFQQAWNALRDMAEDQDYRDQVLKHVSVMEEALVV